MRAIVITLSVVSLLLFSFRAISQSGTLSDEQVIANVDSALGRLERMQKEIKEIHLFLATMHPVAVVEGGEPVH
jgi:hypothetical protein